MERKYIALYGKTNSGKSTLFNKLIGQQHAIVSEQRGTTTDPVLKTMELIPYGPVTLADTAGTDDISSLGAERLRKTNDMLRRCDMMLYVSDATVQETIPHLALPYILVFTKCDIADERTVERLKVKYPEAIFLNDSNVNSLKGKIINLLNGIDSEKSDTLVGNLIAKGSSVVMVIPIDSEAPKGRLILPQVQILRDCLDNRIKAYVTTETEFEQAFSELKRVDAVICDSQVFKEVSQKTPPEIPLTSFSMILACYKGDIKLFIEGAKNLDKLCNGAKILMLEACTHNSTHEDIGRIKIPKLVKKRLGFEPQFDYYTSYDFPQQLEQYDMAVMCGSCMINRNEVTRRMRLLAARNIPVTNYGVLLAHLNGILERAGQLFLKER